jgi:putative CocE/NonD family hydrolase
MTRFATFTLLFLLAGAVPATAQSAADSLDSLFTRREAMIPMRDGPRLFTVILTPRRRTADSLPFILSRTPYGTDGWGGTQGIAYGFQELIRDGYIFVFQDIRGRYRSEGKFVMNRPACARRGEGCSDEATDTWDTIAWLVRNVPGNNGRVGQLGISYPGFLTNASAFDPHPALKALSPQATMGDAWMGDDFFHQGAFRLSYGLEYAWEMEASSDRSVTPRLGRFDGYDWYRSFPSLDSLAKAVGAYAWPTWRHFVEHPAYDSLWRARALPLQLRHATVPTLNVGGWWDQEDAYGPQATYRAMESSDSEQRNFIAIGPWYHGEWFLEGGDSLGNARFGSNTAVYYRREIEATWFRHWLKGADVGKLPEARVFDAGARLWRSFDSWPPRQGTTRRLYLLGTGRLGFEPPRGTPAFDQYVSDPAHPVPYRPRPVERTYAKGSRWERWLTEDQRFVEGRPDVLVWQTDPLTEDLSIAGDVSAKLFASTTGTDADWVVKLIDVYPDSVAERPGMGGYQLMVTGDIMRGRYYRSFSAPRPIPADQVTRFTVDLHQQAYTFKRGHRIMVQVQSTWFPLYDRNPQTYVPNIFRAKASDYRARTHRVYHTPRFPSYVEVRVVP